MAAIVLKELHEAMKAREEQWKVSFTLPSPSVYGLPASGVAQPGPYPNFVLNDDSFFSHRNNRLDERLEEVNKVENTTHAALVYSQHVVKSKLLPGMAKFENGHYVFVFDYIKNLEDETGVEVGVRQGPRSVSVLLEIANPSKPGTWSSSILKEELQTLVMRFDEMKKNSSTFSSLKFWGELKKGEVIAPSVEVVTDALFRVYQIRLNENWRVPLIDNDSGKVY